MTVFLCSDWFFFLKKYIPQTWLLLKLDASCYTGVHKQTNFYFVGLFVLQGLINKRGSAHCGYKAADIYRSPCRFNIYASVL